VTLLVLVPLRAERAALGRRPGWRVLRTGMGPERARIAAARALAIEADAVAVVGVCGAVSRELRPGDVVVATELRAAGADPIGADETLAAALRARGLDAHTGPIVSTEGIATSAERRALDALVVDMESAWLARAAGGRPLAVLRVVVDTADRRLLDVRTPAAGIRALSTVRRAAPALDDWARLATARAPDMVATG
jgi:4-hydroxy-3-methylbut-2-en-1-yl diphosphate reductase